MKSIPEWMTTEETYQPGRDRDAFMTKSLLSVMGTLSKLRSSGTDESRMPVPLKMILCIGLIIFASCMRNMFYCYVLLAVILIHLCFLREAKLVRVVAVSAAAAGFSALVMIPAVFLGSPASVVIVPCKVLISVNLVCILAETTNWNRITSGLRFFHVPNMFIFILDITLKYIAILGDICVSMLGALRLRAIGHNKEKSKAISGILGITFLKSRKMADEMCQAMECRGFDGEYRR